MSSDSDEEKTGVDLTGFLFGNIDSEGKLEDDIFDSEVKKSLSSLSRFGFDSFLHEVISDKGSQGDFGRGIEESFAKNENAIDYSDINELAEDFSSPPRESNNQSSNDDYDIEDEIPASKLSADIKNDGSLKDEKSDSDTDKKDDKELMPPPSLPLKTSTYEQTYKSDGETDIKTEKLDAPKKLDTPLAAMLPSKYANVDVRELFPDFRPDKVLRFSRLFGPGKPSSLPQIWRHVKKKRRKRKQSRDHRLPNTGSDSTSDTDELRHGFSLRYGPDPKKEQCVSDDEDKLLSITNDDNIKEEGSNGDDNNENKPKVADWRFGPAQIWYDMLEVPESGDGFNYGFKTKGKQEIEELDIKGEPIADDAYLMVSQIHWEDDVVWDGNDIKSKVLQKLNSKTNAAGWLPSSGSRTAAAAFSQPGKGMPVTATPTGKLPSSTPQLPGKISSKTPILQKPEQTDDTWYSIFPVENEELIYSKWEDEIIWDAESMPKVPKPKVLTLDPNDENIILGIPDDIDPSKVNKNTGPPPKIKIPHPHVKKSKILLGKAGVINVLAEDTPPPPPKSPDRDPFNISNDVYYMPKTVESVRLKVSGGNLIQHSTPVVELRAPFIPTHMGPMKLRMFHRPAMKKYSHGPLSDSNHHPVLPLVKHIVKKAKQRELERIASGGGDVFFMRNPDDLSGKDGDIILVEFCEEHPPLMNQVGMCSKIKNYYKRKAEKDSPPQFKYGEIAYAHTSPFLGILNPGVCIQTVENNMYRAPIYPHQVSLTDFLVIRSRYNYWIREINALFTVGQECPLYEVPGPNSKRANNFARDFLQVFIYRLFWKSKDNPRRIKMDDIKKAFPAHSESSIRKRLKQCADFKRTGMDSNWWVIKPEFRLPSEEEIRAMVSPEQCCAFFSMIAAEQRLKDAGYGEKFIFAQQEDDDEEQQLKMDDEVKVAPWNTTRAYIQAMRGKCLLQLTGPADPTGCGEGFSYVRVPNKPTQTKEEQESQPKRTVTGTDADLRRLPLNKAKELLRKFKVPEEEIKKLSRWEVIDVVRTLSTEKAKQGEQGMDKFSRGNRFSIAEHQERYKEECQRIFDLQNKVLASSEILSTDEDEDSSASEESDIEEMGKNLENMLANKKTSTQLSLEREEQERQELLKKIMEGQRDNVNSNKNDKKNKDEQQAQNSNQGRILKITRVFKDSEGKEYTRVETVRRQPVIDAYVKIRTTKDEAFIKQFATLDEQQKEEMKREKRRLQEQLRRIKRNQERERAAQLQKEQQMAPGGIPTNLGDPKTSNSTQPGAPSSKDISPSRRKIRPINKDLKLKCGACGQVGHMRTNKACPLYTGSFGPTPPVNVAVTEEQEEEIEKELNADDEDLVNVDGTKVKLSSKLLKRHEDVKRRTLLLKVPKEAVGKKRRRLGEDLHCDYLKRHNQTANRRRTDPVVLLSSILEEILGDLRDMPDVTPFMFPVNAKLVPDYHRIVTRPMDLQTIRENLRQKRYQSREEFLADVHQIVENCSVYNGLKSPLTMAAERMLQKCVDRLAEKEEKLMLLEKAINPLLDDDDQVALSFIFEKLINGKLKMMHEAWPFLKPVNKKQVKDYYSIIKRPMDLETISKKVAAHKYHSREEFLADIELIAINCETYNGSESTFTKNAKGILEYSKNALNELGEHCAQLEKNIAEVQERARANADLEGVWENDDQYGELQRISRASTPENEFVDIEGNERPQSAASATTPQNRPPNLMPGPPPIIAPLPEIKRGRGRPRKVRDGNEEEKEKKIGGVKRGRGRPRKDSLTSNQSNTQNSVLEDDLQCSSDDEEFEEVTTEDESVAVALNQGEGINATSVVDPSIVKIEPVQPIEEMEENVDQDDSKQVAEAMVQLSGIGFYPQSQDETMDLDPNYDPSDFLQMPNKMMPPPPVQENSQNVQNDHLVEQQQQQFISDLQMQGVVNGQLQFSSNDPQYLQTQQQLGYSQEEQLQYSQPESEQYEQNQPGYQQQEEQNSYQTDIELTQKEQQQVSYDQEEQQSQEVFEQKQQYDSTENDDSKNQAPNQSNIHDDLAISDSDEEENKFVLKVAKEEKEDQDDDALWF
ncbi:transcription initiation factor TFIID subunit 1 [Condylostylus longicornis]|uniref:transcription initiation factor TFIID subunit 1 n=1 Tax=Condylostylus longicornis TaxID=2530218 RepID=UPI00244DB1FB|nr:transcription initiation factor TFIID subunit 1 [Condylostylus longicornis]